MVKRILLGLIVVITTLLMGALSKPGMPMFHDSNPHVARMIAFHTALNDGQFPPMWAKELLGGIGSPVMMLNYQLPYFIAEGFIRLGLDYFEAYKATLALSFVVSGVVMYLALASKYKPIAAYVGALVYTLAPYRFVDIYVRGALGESLSFIFPPLLLWGLAKSSLPMLIVGWAGLFLTHPVAAAIFSAFYLGYTIWASDKVELKMNLRYFWGPYFVALAIAAFNLIPTLSLTKYTYYSPGLSDTLKMFPTLQQLFYSPWGYGVSMPGTNDGMSFQLGIIQWVALGAGIVLAIKTKIKELRYLVMMSLVCMFFILEISIPLYQLFGLTQIIDFPWRLLIGVVFASAWIAAIVVNYYTGGRDALRRGIGVVVVSTLTLGLLSLPMARTNNYFDKSFAWFMRETGDSYGEYAPLTRATRDSAPFGKRSEFVQGEGEIVTQIEKSNHQKYLIRAKEAGVVRINTAYFPGWQMPDNCRVSTLTLSHIDDSGLFLCQVEKGESSIEIKFISPPVQVVGNLITLAGIGGFLWIILRSYYPPLTKRRR